MKSWADKYNALPIEIREITSKILIETQINQLFKEKARLRVRYEQSMKEINEHINILMRAYNDYCR